MNFVMYIKAFVDLSSVLTLLGTYISKEWQMNIFIRHKCGERKNNVGQLCYKQSILDNYIFSSNLAANNTKTSPRAGFGPRAVLCPPFRYVGVKHV